MPEQKNSNAAVLEEDGVRVEDLFRRATFNWALSTKKMVDTAAALGRNSQVSRAALADIEYARDLLDGLFLPSVVKGSVAPVISVSEVNESVLGFLKRAGAVPAAAPVRKTPFNARVEPSPRRGLDLSAPVESKNGRMLWATVDCPVCPSGASQRCQRDDGGFIEKPHPARKTLAERARNT